MADLIIRRAILPDGATADLAVTGNRFSAIAPAIAESAAEELNAEGMHILPPFYNCHTHAAMVLLRGYADDLELFPWLNDHIWPAEARLTPEAVYHGSRLAVLEMIKSGTVFFNDHYFFPRETIRAVEEMGVRACIGLCWLNNGDPAAMEQRRREHAELVADWKAGRFSPRIYLAYAPHAIYTVPEADLRRLNGLAAAENMTVHIHLAETETEFNQCRQEHCGLTPVEYLDSLGLLNGRIRLAHCVWLTDRDIGILKERDATVVTNTTSNLKLASGMFRFHDVDRAGIRLTLGTDGCASNNAHSFFSEMKTAALSAKWQARNPTAAPAAHVFNAATTAGAMAFTPGAGSIAVGAIADAMLINPQQPYMVGNYNLVSNLVYAAESNCVDSLVCDGRILMRHRRVPGEDEIIAAARRCCEAIR